MSVFCRDCKHLRKESSGPDWAETARCGASQMVNLVTGETKLDFCATARMDWQACGPEGKLFVPQNKRLREQLERSLAATVQ